jgi:hypothetical protein
LQARLNGDLKYGGAGEKLKDFSSYNAGTYVDPAQWIFAVVSPNDFPTNKTCNFKFSERRSTFFFGLHTKEPKIKEVIRHLLEGMSFREAAHASHLDKDTVQRIWKRFMVYCEESVESLLKELNIQLEDLILLLYNRTQKGLK